MRRSLAVAAVVALFLVGIVVGVLATHAFYLRQLREPGAFATRFLAMGLRRSLDLSVEQQGKLDAILLETRGEALGLRREVLPKILAMLERSQGKIEAILTPEQLRTYRRYRERDGDRLKRFLLLHVS